MRLSLKVATLLSLFLSDLVKAQAQCPNSSQGVDPAVFETCIPAPTSTVPVQCPTSTEGINPEVFSACILAPGQTSRVVPTSTSSTTQSSSAQSPSSTSSSSSSSSSSTSQAAATATTPGPSSSSATNGRTTAAARTTSSTTPAAASSSTRGAAGAGLNSAASNNGSNHHYRNTVIIPAVVASVVGALLIAAIVICCLLVRRRRRKRGGAAGVRIDSPPSEDEKQFAGDSVPAAAPAPVSAPVPAPVPTPIYDTHRQQPQRGSHSQPPLNSGRAEPVHEMSAEPAGTSGMSSGLPLAGTAIPFMTANTHEDSYRPNFGPSPATPNAPISPTRSSTESPGAKPWAAQPLRQHFRRKSLRDSDSSPPPMTEIEPGPSPTTPVGNTYAAYRPGSMAATPPPTGPLPPVPTGSQQQEQSPGDYHEFPQRHGDQSESDPSHDYLDVQGNRPEYSSGLSAVDEASVEDDASYYSRRGNGDASGLNSVAGSKRSRNDAYGGHDPSGNPPFSPEESTSEQLPNSPALNSWLQSRGIDLSLNDSEAQNQPQPERRNFSRKPVSGFTTR